MFVVGVGLDSNLKIERMIRSVFQFPLDVVRRRGILLIVAL